VRLSREEVLHIARLARLGLTEAEVERFQEQLSNILENFQVLQEVETRDVPPTTHAVPQQNVSREDQPGASLPQEKVLANAPQQEEGLFKVRAVLE